MMQLQPRLIRRFVLPVYLSLAVLGCQPEITLLDPPGLAESARDLEPVGSQFAADVEVSGPSFSLPGKGEAPKRTILYHVTKEKRAGGYWRTTYSQLRSSRSAYAGSDEPVPGPLSRIVVDDSAGVTLFDRDGAEVDPERLQAPDSLKTRLRGSAPSPAAVQLVSKSQAGNQGRKLSAALGGGMSEGAGLTGLLVAAGQRHALMADLRKRGKWVGGEGSRQRYEISAGLVRMVVDVDSVIGAVVLLQIVRPGSPTTNVSYEYDRAKDGRHFRTVMRSEREPYGKMPGATYETRLSNVVMTSREGL